MEHIRHAEKALAVIMTLVMCLTALIVLVPPSRAEPMELGISLTSLSEPRAFAGTAFGDDGRLYVIGGVASSTTTPLMDTVIIYDATTGDSSYGHKMTVGVWGAACVKGADGKIYVAGGYNDTAGAPVATTQIYDPDLDSWTTGHAMTTAMYSGAASLGSDGKIYVFGGWNAGPLDATQIYDPVLDTWTAGAAMPVKKNGHSSVTVGPNSILVIGGGNFTAGATDRVDAYNPVTNTWSSKSPMNLMKSYAGAAMGRNGLVYSFGGRDDPTFFNPATEYDQIERYDTTADSWEISTQTLTQSDTEFGTAVDAFGRVFVVGGFTVASDVLSSVEMFLPSSVRSADELVMIVSPTGGSIVSGTVAVQVIVANDMAWMFLGVDLWVDGSVVETQAPTSSMTFLWNTSALVDHSSHTLTARGYLYTGGVSEDTITVTVASLSVEERIAAIEQQMASLQDDITAIQAKLLDTDSNVTLLRADLAVVQAQLTGLQYGIVALGDGLSAMGAGQAAAMAQLNVTIVGLLLQLDSFQAQLDSLQLQLDDFQTQIDRVENKADNAGMIGIVTVILIVIVLLLVVMMFMAARKKA